MKLEKIDMKLIVRVVANLYISYRFLVYLVCYFLLYVMLFRIYSDLKLSDFC